MEESQCIQSERPYAINCEGLATSVVTEKIFHFHIFYLFQYFCKNGSIQKLIEKY